MPQVRVSELKKGSILNAAVTSPLSGTIMEKGTKVLDREYEILLAFQVDTVDIELDIVPEGSFISNIFNKPSTFPTSRDVKVVDSPVNNVGSSLSTEDVNHQGDLSAILKPQNFEEQFILTSKEMKAIIDSVFKGMAIRINELRERLAPLFNYSFDPSNILVTLKQNYPLEDYLYFHSTAVSYISAFIAKWSKIPDQNLLDVAVSGALHDIGKTKISSNILRKNGPLTKDEWKEMKKYPVHGYHMIKGLPSISDGITLGVLQHQEREDGSGYPLSLRSGSIHIYAKMIAIADMFHAMCSSKLYGQANSPYLALEELLNGSFGKLNPEYVHAFVDSMTHFSIGTMVELNNGSIGRIVFVDASHPTRPMVEVNGTIINLALNRNLVILKVLV